MKGVKKKTGEGNNVFIMFLMCLRILLFSISEHQLLLPAGGEGRGMGGPDTDHLQNWYELSWQTILPVSGDRLWGSFSFKQKKTLNWDWELFPRRSLSAASVLNSRHGFNFLNRVLWQTLGGVQPNLFWSVEGSGSKVYFADQEAAPRRLHFFCTTASARMAEPCWKSPNECHAGLFDIGEKAVNEKGT